MMDRCTFLELLRKVADRYDVEAIENSTKGGIFYRDTDNNFVEVPVQ